MTIISSGLQRFSAAVIAMTLAGGSYAGTAALLKDLDTSEVIASTNPWYAGTAWQRAILPDEVQDVALMSDGLEPLAMQFATRKAHEPFFRTVLAPLHAVEGQGDVPALSAGLTTLLASPAVRSRTDDDASLVIATRRSAQP